jgi:hypothetical protein
MVTWKSRLAATVGALAFLACIAAPDRPILLFESAIDERGLQAFASLGGEQCFIIYQGDVDPDSAKSGLIDVSKLIRHIVARRGDQPEGWGVLDFEDPFDAMIQKGADSPECKAAVETMVQAIRVLKRAFPKVKWTYYGAPGLLYYLPDGNWDTASRSSREAEERKQLAAYGPILAECDWLAPCIYNTVGDDKGSKVAPDAMRRATRAWVAARTAMCVRFLRDSGRSAPVIPFGSPLYMAGGGARAFSVMPANVLRDDEVVPAMRAGAGGMCIWTGAENFVAIATGRKPDTGFTEGGGKPALVRRWSEDLGVDPAVLSSEDGGRKLTSMISQAQVAMARLVAGTHPPAATPTPPTPTAPSH